MRYPYAALLLAGLAACSDNGQAGQDTVAAEPAAQPTAAAAPSRDEWVGRWVGVEGLNLQVEKGGAPGRYQLQMQYGTDADMSGRYEGTATADGIAFTRPDGEQVLRAASGDETGLKYLAGKTDCLKVKDGEGYCRG